MMLENAEIKGLMLVRLATLASIELIVADKGRSAVEQIGLIRELLDAERVAPSTNNERDGDSHSPSRSAEEQPQLERSIA